MSENPASELTSDVKAMLEAASKGDGVAVDQLSDRLAEQGDAGVVRLVLSVLVGMIALKEKGSQAKEVHVAKLEARSRRLEAEANRLVVLVGEMQERERERMAEERGRVHQKYEAAPDLIYRIGDPSPRLMDLLEQGGTW